MKREPAGEVTNRARPHTLSRRRSAAQATLGLPCETAIFAVMPETDPARSASYCPGNRAHLRPRHQPGMQARSTAHTIAAWLTRGHVTTNFTEPNDLEGPGPGRQLL